MKKFRNIMTPKCSKCGERRMIGNTRGIPNMVGFQMEYGKTINLCNVCMMKLGAMKTEEEKEKFFDDLGI